MRGKNTFQKSLRRMNRIQSVKTRTPLTKSIRVGSWSLQENEEGDLVIINMETGNNFILALKEEDYSSNESGEPVVLDEVSADIEEVDYN